MNTFRTEIQIDKAPIEIIYNDLIMMFGSCFAENIGNKLFEARFNININPFGILYNPLSVAEALTAIINKKVFVTNDLIFDGEMWHSPMHHGKFSDTNADMVISNINQSIIEANNHLEKSSFLFITFGTAWVYEDKKSKNIVGNCHKRSASEFNRYRLTTEQIVHSLSHLIKLLSNFNPQLQIIFTVSPVRHWKDTAHGNQLSKSTLLLAIETLLSMHKNCHYFPAYELVLDDLRDYRFYASDMLHPNDLAIDYIWQKLKSYCFGKETITFCNETTKLSKSLMHRPIHPNTQAHKKFLETQLKFINEMLKKYPSASPIFNDLKQINDQLALCQRLH